MYRVMIQSDPLSRKNLESLKNIKVRNSAGEMAPIAQFISVEKVYGPEDVYKRQEVPYVLFVLSFDSQTVTWCKNKCSLPINTILLANLLKNEAMDSCRNHYLCCFYFFFSLILLPLLADIISYNYSYA